MDAPSGQVMKSVAGWTGAALILFTARQPAKTRERVGLVVSCSTRPTASGATRRRFIGARNDSRPTGRVSSRKSGVAMRTSDSLRTRVTSRPRAYLNNFYYRFQCPAPRDDAYEAL
jgi:hypothetical protein